MVVSTTSLLAVTIGGGIGAGLRYLVNIAATQWFGHGFPYGTAIVNILGSLLMGVTIGLLAKFLPVADWVRPFVVIGLLGGFTTFSTFSLDIVNLYENQQLGALALYIIGSVILGVTALIAGLWLVRIAS